MYCLNCDYDLRHCRSSNCPECGQAFDAGDPSTFRTRPRPPRWPWVVTFLIPSVAFCAATAFFLRETMTTTGFDEILGPNPSALPLATQLGWSSAGGLVAAVPAAIIGILVGLFLCRVARRR